MIIAAFDPGIALTGYAFVEGDRAIDYGTISTPPKTFEGDRCVEIYDDVISLLEKYKPVQVAYERPQFGSRKDEDGKLRNNTNSAIVQYGVGALLMAFSRCGYSSPVLFAPSSIKKAVTGRGNASKLEVRDAVFQHYCISERKGDKDDAYDALAGAIALHNALLQNAA